MGNFQFVEVGEESTVSNSQSRDCVLICSVRLLDAVIFCSNVQALSPLCPQVVSKDGFCFAVEHEVQRLLKTTSHFGQLGRSAYPLPPTPQWEGFRWTVIAPV